MILRANCKINIGLDLLRRREDGYHELSTLMFPVRGLYDELTIERAAQNVFHSKGLAVDCSDDENLCMRAVRLMQARYDVGGVAVALDKRVPFGAGLGGGSADATAVIVAVNEIFDLHLPELELIACAATLGSDTAFFVRNTPQLCRGRGEIMDSYTIDLSGYTLVIAKPAEGVSTREAYAGVRPSVPATSLAERLQIPVTQWQGCIKNDFEPHIFAAHPTIRAVKERLLDAGAIYASMSGSGSAVYGLFVSDACVPERVDLPDGCQVFVYML